MKPDKVLCFELFGDHAQFRKFFTNMSPLSFSIPPRTVVSGVIGAIVGIDKAENPETFSKDKSFIALRIMNPIRKVRIAHNYLKTTSPTHLFDFPAHKPTNVEFLKSVRYRIYFSCEDRELYARLKSLLHSHKSVYTVCLGISGCLANFDYMGEHSLTPVPPDQRLTMSTITPMSAVKELLLDLPLKLQKVVLPITMTNSREVTSYGEVLFEMNGAAIPMICNDTSYVVDNLNDTIHEF
ncbi:MAG: type I-B CRISPR-associated protein Cas5b [Candidatus Cloacimonadaceae bacterium]|jgi:CRISPR-associated protein Cas5h|nr:type I-B CRISPR-associated protein Cas5b [Candidatus Cloacimonadaceae bacterium]